MSSCRHPAYAVDTDFVPLNKVFRHKKCQKCGASRWARSQDGKIVTAQWVAFDAPIPADLNLLS